MSALPAQPKEFSDERITKLSWKGPDSWLVHGVGSNFFVEPDGTNVEAAFQAMKHENPFKRRVLIRKWARLNPHSAKKWGRKLPLRPDWEDVKFDVMLGLVQQKFENPLLAEWLISTGNRLIIEGNYWHDNTWGVCHCQQCVQIDGKNWLGKILMMVRQELRGPWIEGTENPPILGR